MPSSNREQVSAAEVQSLAGLSYPRRLANWFVATEPFASTHQFAMLAAVLVTSFLLRLPSLGSTSLWLDEIWSISTARLPWRTVAWVVVHKDSNAGLYYALLHMWLRLGSSEATVRFLSVLLGVATIPVLYLLGNRLFGKPVGLIASLLLTVNKLHISQSQDARTYSLVVLLVTVSSLYFVRSVEQSTRGNWCLYVLASVLAIYAHVFAVLVIAAQLVSLVFQRPRDIPWKGLLASSAAIGALALPVGMLLRARMHEPGAPLAWAPKLGVGVVCRLFWSLCGASHYGLKPAFVAGIALTLGYFGLCLVSLVRGVQLWRTSGFSIESWRLGFALSWLLVPITLAVIVSIVSPVLVDKYLIVCLPALVIVAAKGIQSIGSKWSATATVSIVALAVLALLPYWHSRFHDHEWQTVTGTILSQARPGDAIIFFVAPGRLLFDYYRVGQQGLNKGPELLYPDFTDENIDPAALAYTPPFDEALLNRASSHYQRVWLVLYHSEFPFTNPASRQIQSFLSARYRKQQETRYEGSFDYERVEILLYAVDPTQAETRLSRSSSRPNGFVSTLGSPPELVSGN